MPEACLQLQYHESTIQHADARKTRLSILKVPLRRRLHSAMNRTERNWAQQHAYRIEQLTAL